MTFEISTLLLLFSQGFIFVTLCSTLVVFWFIYTDCHRYILDSTYDYEVRHVELCTNRSSSDVSLMVVMMTVAGVMVPRQSKWTRYLRTQQLSRLSLCLNISIITVSFSPSGDSLWCAKMVIDLTLSMRASTQIMGLSLSVQWLPLPEIFFLRACGGETPGYLGCRWSTISLWCSSAAWDRCAKHSIYTRESTLMTLIVFALRKRHLKPILEHLKSHYACLEGNMAVPLEQDACNTKRVAFKSCWVDTVMRVYTLQNALMAKTNVSKRGSRWMQVIS